MSQDSSTTAREQIVTQVMRDLNPSWLVTHTKVAVASVVGGLLSLLVCGQFGLGFTGVANNVSDTIHASMDPVPCAVVCGVLFAIFPIALLRLTLCHPLQFRAIMKRRWQAILVWFGGFGGALAFLGHHGSDAFVLAAWIFGAVVAANALAHLMFVVAPTWNLSARLQRV